MRDGVAEARASGEQGTGNQGQGEGEEGGAFEVMIAGLGTNPTPPSTGTGRREPKCEQVLATMFALALKGNAVDERIPALSQRIADAMARL